MKRSGTSAESAARYLALRARREEADAAILAKRLEREARTRAEQAQQEADELADKERVRALIDRYVAEGKAAP
jgi:hypothetical protein